MVSDQELREMVELVEKVTKEPWVPRGREGQPPEFVERPRQPGQAYGQGILADSEYETKQADIAFIARSRALVLQMARGLLALRAAVRDAPHDRGCRSEATYRRLECDCWKGRVEVGS